MDVVVCSDTLGMHLAIALKKKIVVLFGPTCPQEIDLYGRGVKALRRRRLRALLQADLPGRRSA